MASETCKNCRFWLAWADEGIDGFDEGTADDSRQQYHPTPKLSGTCTCSPTLTSGAESTN